ncbi:MAG: 2-C-methyl-D-erythritol 4-phosphate cytidylyltransferase, partial [Acidobacteria bacterium]|nr:2-C-methyl-D-erythritol 4-phosphate cytidylyltransferase [Acidobacteriota bacterium]
VEHLGVEVTVVPGSERNIKITKPSDLELARFYLEQERHTLGEASSAAGVMVFREPRRPTGDR